jgi:murein DD-endopeptidase MepM/ murein hydrolase activator NlpD
MHQLVDGQLLSFSGDPTVNANYFCWAKPIRAAKGGVVRLVQDQLPDNNGNLFDRNEGNNEIIIEHANGVFTRYAHMRQGSARVTVGQTVSAGTVIAEVGNAGASSGPHLHFHAYKIDDTGRIAAVPVSINHLKATDGTPLFGVPKGSLQYQTP